MSSKESDSGADENQNEEVHSPKSPLGSGSSSPASRHSDDSGRSPLSGFNGQSPHRSGQSRSSSPVQSPKLSQPSSPIEQVSEDAPQESEEETDKQENQNDESGQSSDEEEQKAGSGQEYNPEDVDSEDEKASEHDEGSVNAEDKEDQNSVHVDSDAENKSDDDENFDQKSPRKTPPSSGHSIEHKDGEKGTKAIEDENEDKNDEEDEMDVENEEAKVEDNDDKVDVQNDEEKDTTVNDEKKDVSMDSDDQGGIDDENKEAAKEDENQDNSIDKNDEAAHNDEDKETKNDEKEASVDNENKETSLVEDKETMNNDESKEDVQNEKKESKTSKRIDDSDSDAESEESEVGGLIADIFGESDEEEEFEGFKEDDIESGKASSKKTSKEGRKRAQILSDSEDDDVDKADAKDSDKDETEEPRDIEEDGVGAGGEGAPLDIPQEHKKKIESDDSDDDADRKMREDYVSDFDLMMARKKEENSKRRKRKDVDLISDSDDLIADIIAQMRVAAMEDKELNKQKKTATKKLKILPIVMSQLKKQDLKMAFIDQGVLNVIAEWLTPLPDRSLPHLNIREGMIKQLSDLPSFDQSLLKSSGIGRALMYLFKHPRETKENREKVGKLITEWARPIFNVTTNYHALTKEEREQRDYDHVPSKKRRRRGDDEDEEEETPPSPRKNIEAEMAGDKQAIRPGDKGWVGRARVPMPSNKDYVNRPKWNKEMEFGRGPSKKPLTRIEKHMRQLQDKKRLNKQERANTVSIEGRKMAI